MVQLRIFDVQHGACALLEADNGTRLMIDCAGNPETGWSPGKDLAREGIKQIEMLAISNYDEDHARGAPDLFNRLTVRSLLRNKTVSAATLEELKSEDGMGPGIRFLMKKADEYTGSFGPDNPEPVFEGVERRGWHCNYSGDFDDENNLSMAIFLKCHGVGVMFTGDLEKPGIAKLLERDNGFKQALRETRVFVAPHHGREGGCSEEIVQYLTSTNYVVISDRDYQFDTQITAPFYRRIAKGGPFHGDTRFILTTRKDGTITFNFRADGWGPG